jgi:hypothetical protein
MRPHLVATGVLAAASAAAVNVNNRVLLKRVSHTLSTSLSLPGAILPPLVITHHDAFPANVCIVVLIDAAWSFTALSMLGRVLAIIACVSLLSCYILFPFAKIPDYRIPQPTYTSPL